MNCWGAPYQMATTNYVGVSSQPSNMGANTAMDQYNLATNAANFAQFNQQRQQFQPMQQQMMPQYNQGNAMVAARYVHQTNMPQQQTLQQSNYSASWPLDDASSGVGRSNSVTGQVDSGTNSNVAASLESPQDKYRRDRRELREVEKIKQPKGYGWPGARVSYAKLNRKARRAHMQPDSGKTSSCPICEKIVPLEDWVSHATSHADPSEDKSQEQNVDYHFLADLLKKAISNSETIKSYSCKFCNFEKLNFEEMIKHIQDSEHMHAIYRWIVQPWTIGHERYKEHVPEIPIKSRHLKFHFCEVCLQLAGWQESAVEKHVATDKSHATKLQRMRENMQWIKKGSATRNEGNRARENLVDRQIAAMSANKVQLLRQPTSHLPPPLSRAEKSRDDNPSQRQYGSDGPSRNYEAMEDRGLFQSSRNQQYEPPSSHQAPTDNKVIYAAANKKDQSEYRGQREKYHGGTGLDRGHGSSAASTYGRSSHRKEGYEGKGMGDTASALDGGRRGLDNHRSFPASSNKMSTTHFGMDSNQPRDSGIYDGGRDTRSFRQSPDKPSPTVLNRGKLQEIVHSIRSTSAGEAHSVNVDKAARSKAAVFAMLKGDSASDAKYRLKPLEYGHMPSSDGFLSESDRSHGNRYSDLQRGAGASGTAHLRRSRSTERLAYSRGYDGRVSPYHSLDRFDNPLERSESRVSDALRAIDPLRYSPSLSSKDQIYPEKLGPPDLRDLSFERRKFSPEILPHQKISPEQRRASPDHRRPLPERRRTSPYERRPRSQERRKRSPERRRDSPKRRRQSAEKRRRSPERRRRSPERRRVSPGRQKRSPDRNSSCVTSRGRTPEGRSRSLDKRSRSTRGATPKEHSQPQKGNAPNDGTLNKKPKRRLSPLVLDPVAREGLTKEIETTWQKYYHKYYSCVMTNPEIVLEMQKEYLRSYRGFFKQNPHFEFYYTKVAKPEDLREALTLRINRGSPGPDPNEALVDTYVNTASPPAPGGHQKMGKASGSLQSKPIPPKVQANPNQLQGSTATSKGVNSTSLKTHGITEIQSGKSAVGSKSSSVDKFQSKGDASSHKLFQLEEKKVSANQMNRRGLPPPASSHNSRRTHQNREPSPLPPPGKNVSVSKPKLDEHKGHQRSLGELSTTDNHDSQSSASATDGFDPNKLDGVFSEASRISTNVEKLEHSAHEDRFQDRKEENRFKNREEDEIQVLEGDDRFKDHEELDRFRNHEEESSVIQPVDATEIEQSSVVPPADVEVVDILDSPDDSDSPNHIQNDPIITSTTQGFPAERKRAPPDSVSSKPRSVLGRLGPQRRTTNLPSGKGHASSSHSSSGTRELSRAERRAARGHEIYRERRRRREALNASSESALTEMFTDPFLAFVHKTLTGIILIGQYQESMATSTEPAELLAKINTEQEQMQARMVTSDGHLLIQLARCCVEDPENIEKTFPQVNADLGPILRNLDKQVVTLIADTPIIVNQPAHSL